MLQPAGRASATRKANINTVKSSRKIWAKIIPVLMVVIAEGETADRTSDSPRLKTAAKTTGLPKQPRALLNLLRHKLFVHQATARNTKASIAAEITIPAIPSRAVCGNSSRTNSITNITAVIKARNAAVAMLTARFIKKLLS